MIDNARNPSIDFSNNVSKNECIKHEICTVIILKESTCMKIITHTENRVSDWKHHLHLNQSKCACNKIVKLPPVAISNRYKWAALTLTPNDSITQPTFVVCVVMIKQKISECLFGTKAWEAERKLLKVYLGWHTGGITGDLLDKDLRGWQGSGTCKEGIATEGVCHVALLHHPKLIT